MSKIAKMDPKKAERLAKIVAKAVSITVSLTSPAVHCRRLTATTVPDRAL